MRGWSLWAYPFARLSPRPGFRTPPLTTLRYSSARTASLSAQSTRPLPGCKISSGEAPSAGCSSSPMSSANSSTRIRRAASQTPHRASARRKVGVISVTPASPGPTDSVCTLKGSFIRIRLPTCGFSASGVGQLFGESGRTLALVRVVKLSTKRSGFACSGLPAATWTGAPRARLATGRHVAGDSEDAGHEANRSFCTLQDGSGVMAQAILSP